MQPVPKHQMGMFFQGVGLALPGKFIGKFLSVIGDIAAARILGPSTFGLYSIGWTLLRIIGLVAPLGLPNGAIRFIPILMHENKRAVIGLIKQLLIVSFLSGMCIGVVFYLFSPWLAIEIYKKPMLIEIFRLFAMTVPFIVLLSVSAAISRSTQIMTYSVLIEDLGQPFFALVILGIFYLIEGPWLPGIILSDIISFFISSLFGLWAVKIVFSEFIEFPRYTKVFFGEVMAYSVPTALAGTFSVFVFWVDRLMVGYYLPAIDNGYYQAASQISVIFVLILAAFNSILSPIFADLHAKNDIRHLEEIFQVGTKWGLYISIPIFLVICFVPRAVLSVFFGEGFAEGSQALVILAIGQIINIGTGSVGALLTMTGYQRIWLQLSFISLLVNIGLCSILIPKMGISGAALSTSISLNIMYIAGIIVARKSLNIWPYDRRISKGVLATLISLMVLIVIKFIFNGTQFWSLVLMTLLAVTIFFHSLIKMGLDKEDSDFLMFLYGKFNRKLNEPVNVEEKNLDLPRK